MNCKTLSNKALVGVASLLLVVQTAAADEELEAIRLELDAIKTQYEMRIQSLEQRLQVAERQLAEKQAAGQQFMPIPGGGSVASANNQYNPAIGVILDGTLWAYENDPQDQVIPGFPQGGESGLDEEGLSIGETELVFSANVDNWFYGKFTAAVEQEDGDFDISVEEAYVDTLSMPGDMTLRLGRFFSSIGYLNDKHAHTWAFADQALPYRTFLGSQYGDDGIQLRWLAPTDFFLEFGAEVFRGSNYPAAGSANNGFGTQSLFAHVGGDVGYSNSWSAGISWLGAEADDRDSGDEDDPLRFNGDSDIYIADLVWKWAPNGNMRERNLTFQTEYLWRNENGSVSLPGGGDPQAINDDSNGWYAQLIYQWRPRWRMGLRIDGLDTDDPGPQFANGPLNPLGDDPRRYSIMFDYSNSEFSRIRLQYNRDETGPEANNQIGLQYIMSIGAHGAHEF